MMASHLSHFLHLNNANSQVSHFHLDPVWTVYPDASLSALIFPSFLFTPPPVFSHSPFRSSVTTWTSIIYWFCFSTTSCQDHPAEHICAHCSSFIFLSRVVLSQLVILLYFLPSVLAHSFPPTSQLPQSLPTHLPHFIQSLSTNNQAFPPGSSGQRSRLSSPTHNPIPPPASEQTGQEKGKWSSQ